MTEQNIDSRVVASSRKTVDVLVTAHTYRDAIIIEPEHIKYLKKAFEYCRGWLHLDATLKSYDGTVLSFVIKDVPQKDYINSVREFVRTADKVMQAVCNYDDVIKNKYFQVNKVSYDVIE